MVQALHNYDLAYKEAKTLDDEGTLGDTQAGGSSHGVTEALYRLHASRLKCLIYAVRVAEEYRWTAELEALRITERCWYGSAPEDPDGHAKKTIRERVWIVLADVVSCLAQCRLEEQFFHRSVYRYAQAMMWAPALHDPAQGFVEGSIGRVPATKSHLLRGLNSSTGCAFSAEVVMSPLFEKRR